MSYIDSPLFQRPDPVHELLKSYAVLFLVALNNARDLILDVKSRNRSLEVGVRQKAV